MRFDGKKVLVTGAASGIGRAVAQRFAREGASVVAADVNLPEAEAALRDLPGAHRCVAFDAGDPDSCRAAVATAAENGGLDVVCNIAGILDWGPTLDFDEARFARVVAVDLLGVYAVTRAALPFLIPVKGAIVNMASTAGLTGLPYSAAYAAAKHGVVGLTKSLAIEFAAAGVRINAVCPGQVDTPMTRRRPPSGEMNWDLVMRNVPKLADGISSPDDIAKAVLFRASAEARTITGAVLAVDGAQVAG